MPKASNIVPFVRPAEKTAPWAFGPIDVKFRLTNDEFSKSHLFYVRMAAHLCRGDWRWAEEKVRAVLSDPDKGLLDSMLFEFEQVRESFEGLITLIKCAEDRVLLTLDRIAPDRPSAA